MRSVIYFFLLTYVISGTFFITALIGFPNRDSPDAPFSVWGYIFYFAGVFAPALVAIFLSWLEKGKTGVLRLLNKIIRAPSDWRWYVFAVAYLVTIKLFAAIIYRMAIGDWPSFGNQSVFIIAVAIIFSTPAQAGEEIGWRGFALPRLWDRFGGGIASIVLGIGWACWHLPFFFFQNPDKYGQSFPVYLLSVTAISIAMAWLYWRTGGSLLITMLMHSAINNTTGIVPSALPGATNPFSMNASFIAWAGTAILWIFALYFLIRMRGAKIAPA